MIINEISMMSPTLLNKINQQCNKIRVIQQDSTAILDALSIVMLMSDFHQFASVQDQSLWQPTKDNLVILDQLI